MNIAFRPKLLDCLKDYSAQKFQADLIAGIIVGIVALPLAMAFAIGSGVTPQAGIFTAIIAGFLCAALGGSKVAVTGPTGAFIVIVYGIVVQYGLANLLICTIMAGVMLVVMGVTRMGSMIKYIPEPLIIGFTNGIAVLIFLTQVKDFLGLAIEKMPADFFSAVYALATHIHTVHWPTLGLAAALLVLIWFWPKNWSKRAPGPLMALVLGTILVALMDLPVQTIGSKFGGIPQALPEFQIPDIDWDSIRRLIVPAFTIALLCAIESLLCAVVADGMIDDRHDPNQELLAQGIANITTPLFGGIPATGAIVRTTSNIKNGGQTPVSGIVHAAVLLVIVLAAAPLAKYVPLAALAAILIVVSLNMGEWSEFLMLRKYPKSHAAILLTTFFLTVIFDLTIAVEVGMVVTAVLFIRRVAEVTNIEEVGQAEDAKWERESLEGKEIPKGVIIFRVFGSLFFGAADKLESALLELHQEPEVFILTMQRVIALDTTALATLEKILGKLRHHKKHLILCRPAPQPQRLMEQSGFLATLGRENVVADLDEALARARVLLSAKTA